MTTYFSWVPNVIGRLSFSFSGLGSYPSRVVFSSNLRNNGRYFAGYQRRDLSDTSVPIISKLRPVKRFIDKIQYGKTGDFYFVCLMKRHTDEAGIQGKVFVFERSDWLEIRPLFRKAMESVEFISDDDVVLYDVFSESMELGSAFFAGSFTLERNGCIQIVLISQANPSDVAVAPSTLNHACAAQIFFFIRDLFHTHKFHSPDTDTILDVYEPEMRWKSEVNFALARKSIALRRQNTVSSLNRSIGVISYLDSFRENILSEAERAANPFSTKLFRSSIAAAIPEQSIIEENSVWNLFSETKDEILKWMAIVVTLISLIFSRDNFVDNSSIFSRFIRVIFFDNYWVSLLSIVLFMMLSAGLHIAFSQRSSVRDDFSASLVRLTLPFNSKKSSVFIFFFGLALTSSGLFITGYVIHKLLSIP